MSAPIFTPGSFVIFYLPETITGEHYDERHRKERGTYTHSNIDPQSNHHFPFTDGALSN